MYTSVYVPVTSFFPLFWPFCHPFFKELVDKADKKMEAQFRAVVFQPHKWKKLPSRFVPHNFQILKETYFASVESTRLTTTETWSVAQAAEVFLYLVFFFMDSNIKMIRIWKWKCILYIFDIQNFSSKWQ